MNENEIPTNDPRARAMMNAYRLYFNFYADDDQLYDTLDNFMIDSDIANTISIRAIDEYANALHIYFDYDTCPINIIATFHDDLIDSIMLSTDTMPYESMIHDLARRA